MRIPVALAGAALIASALAACGGGDSGGDYCDELKQAKSSIAGSVGVADMNWGKSLKTLRDLAKIAPDDVAAEWKTLDGNIVKFNKALKDADLTTTDLDKIIASETSEIDPDATEKIGAVLESSLASEEFANAWDAVVKDAKKSCDVNLD